jgi:DNA polymerase
LSLDDDEEDRVVSPKKADPAVAAEKADRADPTKNAGGDSYPKTSPGKDLPGGKVREPYAGGLAGGFAGGFERRFERTAARGAQTYAETAGTLAALREGVAKCRLCPLGEGRKGFFFGKGKVGAKLLFVSDPPTERALRENDYPPAPERYVFSGLLKEIFGLAAEDVYLTPIAKCVAGAGELSPETEKHCKAVTVREIELVRPRVVAALGVNASRILSGTDKPMASLRKRTQENISLGFGKFVPLRMVYGLDEIAKNPDAAETAKDDLGKIKDFLDS